MKKNKIGLQTNNAVILRVKEEISDNITGFVLAFLILIGLNILFNSWVNNGTRALYDDDLSTYYALTGGGSISMKDAIFNLGANKCRFLLNFILASLFYMVGKNFEYFDQIIMVYHTLISISVFFLSYFLQEKGKNKNQRLLLGVGCSSLFIASRFAYYDISEILGIMESTALLLAIFILAFLIKNMNKEKETLYFAAFILYVLLLFVHERFVVLFGVFVVAGILKWKNNWSKYKLMLLPFASMTGYMLFRIIIFGNRMLDGTGGSSVMDTFTLQSFLGFCMEQVLYLFGINTGEAYLSGISYQALPKIIFVLIFFSIIAIILILIFSLCYKKKKETSMISIIKKILLYCSFIGCCIISSSVTIRVEMRWIYVSYTAMLLMIFYLISILLNRIDLRYEKITFVGLIVLYISSTAIYENYYRSNWTNLYYWKNKEMASALYESTVGVWGETFADKKVTLVNDNMNWSEDAWQRFFMPYIKSENLQLNKVERFYEVYNDGNADIVLLEDFEKSRYLDITETNKPYQILDGIYKDGWMERYCKIQIMTGLKHNVRLSMYYPNELTGKEIGRVYVNGQLYQEFTFDNNTIELQISNLLGKNTTIEIEFDFYAIEDAGRSENKSLSCVLTNIFLE